MNIIDNQCFQQDSFFANQCFQPQVAKSTIVSHGVWVIGNAAIPITPFIALSAQLEQLNHHAVIELYPSAPSFWNIIPT